MNKTTRLKKPQIPELETLYTFDELGGRPKYGGVEMTSETDIPSFQEIMDETHSAVVAEATARDDADEALEAEIQELAGQTSEALEDEAEARAAADTALREAVNSEASTRGAADNVLQNQIDAIVASSDVKDIVGTKAELDAYDTSTLGDNDIIKVLQDESQSNATTYYRYAEATDSFTLIGAEGPYYTKGQADALLNNKADKATTYTKTEVDATVSGLEADIAAKQDQLTAGENITIDNNVISAAGAGKKVDDITKNWPTNNPDGVGLWSLDSGLYSNPNRVKIYYTNSQYVQEKEFFVTRTTNSTYNNNYRFLLGGSPYYFGDASDFCYVYYSYLQNSTSPSGGMMRLNTTVQNNLNGVSGFYNQNNVALGAQQGKVLKDMIGDLANLSTTDKTNLVAAINEAAGMGGGVTELTSADYNWPTSNPDGVAAWLLDSGVYTAANGVKVYANIDVYASNGQTLIVSETTPNNIKPIVRIYESGTYSYVQICGTLPSSGQGSVSNLLANFNVKQTTGASTTDVMSQNATTRMLTKDGFTSVAIARQSNQTASSGAILLSTALGTIPSSTNSFIVNADGNVSAGASNGGYQIAINGTVDGYYAQAIGQRATATGRGAVALGAGAKATVAGQFDIGCSNNQDGTKPGYNNSNYRLLTGLYDPQSDHDAATKGYVDTAIASAGGAEEISSTDWSDLWQ